jgi:lysozyme family protein
MSFDNALKLVLASEGGYANIPADRGGETYRGIARNFWANWEGWKIIDANKPLRYNQILKNPALDKLVQEFYFENFWLPLKLNFINKDIAALIFDFAVGSGTITSVMQVQKLLNNKFNAKLVTDGKMGSKTIAAINQAPQKLLFDTLKDYRIEFFKRIVKNNPSQQIFLKGWLNRLNKYKFEITSVAVIFAVVLAGFLLLRTS